MCTAGPRDRLRTTATALDVKYFSLRHKRHACLVLGAFQSDPVIFVADVAQLVLELPLSVAPESDDHVDACERVRRNMLIFNV